MNAFFKKDQIDVNIINASKGGKSTRGYYNDFVEWFPNIKNFNPKIFIFYTGLNDSSLKNHNILIKQKEIIFLTR